MAINLVDVYNVMYVGHFRFEGASVTDVKGREIKTGGIYNLLRQFQLRKYNFLKDTWIFCFDRRTNRKEIAAMNGIEYKGGREGAPPELIAQIQLAEKWLRDSGFNVMAFDGFEADDIIGTVAKSLKGSGLKVNVITGDRDMAYLVDEDTSLISPSSNSPDVTFENYEYTAGKRGERVHYNSIFLYKVLRGDSSDKIPAVKRNAYALYNRLTAELKKIGIDLSTLSDVNMIQDIIDVLPEDIKSRAQANWELIRPMDVPEEWLTIKPLAIDNEMFSKFLLLFDMKSIVRKFSLDIPEGLGDFVMRERIRIQDEVERIYSEGGWSIDTTPVEMDESNEHQYEDVQRELTVLEEIQDIQVTNTEISQTFGQLVGEVEQDIEDDNSLPEQSDNNQMKTISDDFRVSDV